jgi:hypothetical protein
MNAPRRRWFQVSLKSLFLLTLLVATFFAGYTLATKQAEAARRRAEAEAEAKRKATERRLPVQFFENTQRNGGAVVDIGFDAGLMLDPQDGKLYRNLGAGKFQDVTVTPGLSR